MEKKELYRYFLGGFIVLVFTALLFTLIFVEGYQEQVVLMIGSVIGYAGAVLQFEFGSSKGSKDKAEQLKK